jgi:hypothetical protein
MAPRDQLWIVFLRHSQYFKEYFGKILGFRDDSIQTCAECNGAKVVKRAQWELSYIVYIYIYSLGNMIS